ncbi:MAG: amidase [Pseudomonadales bacterium]
MNSSDLHYARITDIAGQIERRELSPVELTRHMLERISALDSQLYSYQTVMAEQAMEAAAKAESEIVSGRYRGALHGIPVAVKDLCFTRGVPTRGGLAVLRDFVPDYNATVVQRLESAGAILLGKLNLTEGAMPGYHPDFKIPVNPWDSDLWSGASSSGSAVATAAGLCFASLGSDTGGSIRFPAMANGVVGLKPTYGRVSRYGVLELGETLDHVGPLTRGVEDAGLVLAAISGQDKLDPTSLPAPLPDLSDICAGIAGLRIGYDSGFTKEGTDPELVASIEAALALLESLGASVVNVEVPPEILTVGELWFPICTYEAHKAHASHYPSRSEEYGNYFREFLEIGASVTDAQYNDAMAARRNFSERYESVLATVDAMLCPAGGVTMANDADLYGGAEALAPLFDQAQMQFTIPDDFAGTPTLTLPCGQDKNGIPHAMQLVGKALSEARLCRIGRAYEAATDWHQRRPPLV